MHSFAPNKRLVLAGTYNDLRHDKLTEFLAFLGIQGISERTYRRIREDVDGALSTIADESKRQWADEEKKDGADDINACCDCTWQKRGFSSNFGVTTIMSAYRGKVLDTDVSSWLYQFCENWKSSEPVPEHERDCTHEGSAGSMEKASTKTLFERSVSKYGLRYRYLVGDGDAKNYEYIKDTYVEDAGFVVGKKEDKNHFAKRFIRGIDAIRKSDKTICGKGGVTEKQTKLLGYYASRALTTEARSGGGKVQLRNALWAPFYHKRSSDTDPDHRFCSDGPLSWCPYKKSKAAGTEKEYRHTNDIRPAAMDKVKPVYERLTTDLWIDRLEHDCHTSRNEALHAKYWTRCSKAKRASLTVVQAAVDLGTAEWNDGRQRTAERLHALLQLSVSLCLSTELKRRDAERKAQMEERKDSAGQDIEQGNLELFERVAADDVQPESPAKNLPTAAYSPAKVQKKTRFGGRNACDSYSPGGGD